MLLATTLHRAFHIRAREPLQHEKAPLYLHQLFIDVAEAVISVIAEAILLNIAPGSSFSFVLLLLDQR